MTETPTGNAPNRQGRIPQLTETLRDNIARVVRAGNYLKVAAQFNGISESTMRSWLTRGRKVAAARDAHADTQLYCPTCDLDRTADVEAEEEANAREEERYRAALEGDRDPGSEEPVRAYAVMGPCSSCGTHDRPEPWKLTQRDALYLSFLEAVTQAESAAEVAAVTHWRAAFATDWRAARDFVVRKSPDRWAATTRIQISQDEADRRIEAASLQVLTAVGIDTDALGQDSLLGGDLDPTDAPLDGGLPLPYVDDDPDWGDGDA